jgi:hypothetical protein
MRERNPPRNSQPETHPDDEDASPAGVLIGWIDFRMPVKTHAERCRVAASFCCAARLASNSVGGT